MGQAWLLLQHKGEGLEVKRKNVIGLKWLRASTRTKFIKMCLFTL